MPRYNLAQMVCRAKNPRRSSITFRPIIPPATLASDLYASAYAPVVAAWEQALPGIVAVYERSLSALTQDSPAELGAELDGIERDLSRVVLAVRLRIEQWALRVEKWQRGKWRGAVLSATGVDIGTMIGAGDMRAPIGMSIERNVSLVKSVSEQARSRIGEAVFRGLSQRRAAADVAKDIREAVDMGRTRARNIASDQLAKISSSLASERRREAGVDTWAWRSSHKQHFRPEHAARDEKRYSDNPDDGAPPPADLPGELPYCGCVEQAVLSLDGEF